MLQQPVKVLVADDSVDMRNLFRDIVDVVAEGVALDLVDDGRPAVTHALRTHYHLHLIDVAMPVLDGIQAAREILSQRPQARVYLMSGDSGKFDAALAMSLGIKGVIRKPFGIDVILDLIEEARAHSTAHDHHPPLDTM